MIRGRTRPEPTITVLAQVLLAHRLKLVICGAGQRGNWSVAGANGRFSPKRELAIVGLASASLACDFASCASPLRPKGWGARSQRTGFSFPRRQTATIGDAWFGQMPTTGAVPILVNRTLGPEDGSSSHIASSGTPPPTYVGHSGRLHSGGPRGLWGALGSRVRLRARRPRVQTARGLLDGCRRHYHVPFGDSRLDSRPPSTQGIPLGAGRRLDRGRPRWLLGHPVVRRDYLHARPGSVRSDVGVVGEIVALAPRLHDGAAAGGRGMACDPRHPFAGNTAMVWPDPSDSAHDGGLKPADKTGGCKKKFRELDRGERHQVTGHGRIPKACRQRGTPE